MARKPKPCYVTSGIETNLTLELQVHLWRLVLEEKEDLDYLQVFDLQPMSLKGESLQKITQRQEVPPRTRVYKLAIDQPVLAKVFVIEDTSLFTMLLASEY